MDRFSGWLRFAVGAAVLGTGSGACGGSERPVDSSSRIELSEVASAAVADSLPLVGIAAFDTARVVAWNRRGMFLRESGGYWKPVPLENGETPIAIHPAEEGFEVVTGVSSRAYSWDGTPRGEARAFPPDLRPVHATRASAGWVAAAFDIEGGLRIGPFHPLPDQAWLRIAPDTMPGGRVPDVRLSPWSAGALVSEVEFPFRTWRIGPAGVVGAPLVPADTALGSSEGARWIAMPMIDLGSGFIQTFADLASDRRSIITYDREGNAIREARIQVPMGLVGTSGDGGSILAVRNVGRSEAVWYRWRWVVNKPSPGE